MKAVKQKKVCSLHFKPEDFEFNVIGMKRAALLNTAIPSIFTFPYDDEQPGISATSSAKRICLETQTTYAAALFSSSEDEEHQSAPMMSTPVKNPPSGQAQVSTGLVTINWKLLVFDQDYAAFTITGFWKKILKKSKKRSNEILLAWTSSVSVVNHMWFTCATSKGNVEALQNRWKFIPHHACNEHEWTDGDGKRHRCDHAPLTAHEKKKRMWNEKDSVAFQDLSSLVLDKRLLKDLEKMALFKHTGPLEIFPRALLKYLPKRQAFSYDGIRERCYLAILEHNENIVKRKQATTVTGEPWFKQVYCKKSKQWILKTIFMPHTTQFIGHLIKRVMDRRDDPNIKFKVPTSSLTLPQPALSPNIVPVPKPPKEAATTLFQSRF